MNPNFHIADEGQPPAPSHRGESGWVLAAFSLLLIVGLVNGWLAFGCYLVNEHRRLAWPEMVLLYLGDVIGLFWFLRYVVRWSGGLCGHESPRLESRKIPRTVWLMLLSMAIGFLAELAMTLSLRHSEFVGFSRAVPTVCTVSQIQEVLPQGRGPSWWNLKGTYQDAAGQLHKVTYYLMSKEMQLVPPPLALAIRNQQRPLALPIVYDPERPGRSWIPQLGWDDGNRLHYVSLLILLFQFPLTFVFVMVLWEAIKTHRRLPWWSELHSLIPLGSQAFVMTFFGGLELYVMSRFCP